VNYHLYISFIRSNTVKLMVAIRFRVNFLNIRASAYCVLEFCSIVIMMRQKKSICTSLRHGFNFAKSFESSLLEAKEPSRLSTEHYPLKTSSAYAAMTFLNGRLYKKSRRKKNCRVIMKATERRGRNNRFL